MVFRMELTYSEIEKKLHMKYIDTSTFGYTLPLGVYQSSDIILMLKNSLPNKLKVNIKIDEVTRKSVFTTTKTIECTKRSFFYTILGFTQS